MRALAVAFAALLLMPAAAQAKTIDLPDLFQDVLPQVKAKTNVPVLLPQRYRSDAKKNVPTGVGHKRSYTLSIGAVEGCGGATACFVADFAARRGGKPSFTRTVRLRGGRTVYWIQAHAGTASQEKRRLVKMANSALFHGPR